MGIHEGPIDNPHILNIQEDYDTDRHNIKLVWEHKEGWFSRYFQYDLFVQDKETERYVRINIGRSKRRSGYSVRPHIVSREINEDKLTVAYKKKWHQTHSPNGKCSKLEINLAPLRFA